MRKFFCIILILSVCLSACALGGNAQKEPVTFYYLRTYSGSDTYDDFFTEGIIGSESREASGHRHDLNYLLAMYLQGPLDPQLISPFPVGCKVTEIRQEDNQLTLRLSRMITVKNDMELTIACACLARTCLDLTDADAVHIESRGLDDKVLFTRSFTRNNMLLDETYTQPAEPTETTQ